MNLDKLNNWLTLAANVAVMAGIIFLAVELQQNTKQLELQSYQSWVAANTQINSAISDPNLAAIVSTGHSDSADLTKESYIAYAMHHLSMLQMAQATHYLYLQGAIDEELWQAEMNRAALVISLRGVRQWWDAGGKSQLAPSFVSFLESFESSSTRWNWDTERGFFPDGRSAE